MHLLFDLNSRRAAVACAVAVAVGLLGTLLAFYRDAGGPGRRTAAALKLSTARGPVAVVLNLARRLDATGPAVDSFVIVSLDVDYINPGTRDGFAVYQPGLRRVTVTSVSTRISIKPAGALRFVTATDRQRWIESGRPRLRGLVVSTHGRTVPFPEYSFLPQGHPMSYREVARLPASPLAIREAVVSALDRRFPPPSLLLSEYATLLAVAPLSSGTRAAVLTATGEIQGVTSCGVGTDALGRHGPSLCASGGGYGTRIIFDPRTGRVIGLDRSITDVQQGAPELPRDTVVESKAFRR